MSQGTRVVVFALLGLSLPLQAKDFGTLGHSFAILEEDLLASIQAKLQDLDAEGSLAVHQERVQAHMLATLQRPPSVEGVIRTRVPRTFSYDPSIRVPYDLRDHRNQVFAKAGTVVNPLDSHRFSPWLLIDGDDKNQVAWALAQAPSKIILIKGAPFVLSERHARPFYFDQGGKLIKKLGIRQVPAQIVQKENALQIAEVFLEGQFSTP